MKKKSFILLLPLAFALASCNNQQEVEQSSSSSIMEESSVDQSSNTNITYANLRYDDVSIIESSKVAGAVDLFIKAHDSDANIYFLIVNYDSTKPTKEEILAQGNYQDVIISGHGSGQGTTYLTVSNLEQNKKYDVYVVLKNDNSFSDIYKTTIITNDDDAVLDRGDGSEENPFRIYTIKDLVNCASTDDLLAMNYRLENDLDLSSVYNETTESFTPIGWQTGSLKGFAGNFNGNGHTISNLYIFRHTESNGLFAQIAPGGRVSNLIVKDPNIKCDGQRLGGIVGYNKGAVEKCAVVGGSITSYGTSTSKVGAISGDMYDTGSISSCYSKTTISAEGQNSGGIAGSADTATGAKEPLIIKNCYSFTNITSTAKYVGGIVGYLRSGELSTCYASGTYVGKEGVGGVVGFAQHRTGCEVIPAVTYCISANSKVTATAESSTVSSGKVIGNKSTSNSGVTTSNLYYSNVVVETVKTSSYGEEEIELANLIDSSWLKDNFNINFNAKIWCIEDTYQRPVLVNFKNIDNGLWVNENEK